MSQAFDNAREGMQRVGDRRIAAYDDFTTRQTNRATGNALQAGDYAGAAAAQFNGGNVQGGLSMQAAGQARQTADRDEQRSAIAAAVSGLLHVPEAERAAMLQSRIAPVFQQLGLGEYLSQITPQDLTDQSLRGLAASMGSPVPQNTTFNTRDGVVERDPYSGAYTMGYQVQPNQPNAPPGYRWTETGGLEAIPGGPADTRVIGSRAAAGRAPPRPRSGSSAPRSAPPSPSGGSSSLPPGFTVLGR